MEPTPKLRFVERTESVPLFHDPVRGETVVGKKRVRVLQQWWAVRRAGQITPTGEWRDVGMEKE